MNYDKYLEDEMRTAALELIERRGKTYDPGRASDARSFVSAYSEIVETVTPKERNRLWKLFVEDFADHIQYTEKDQEK